MTVEGRTIIVDLKNDETRDDRFKADADDAVVGDAYRRTARIISPDIARTYTMERAERKPEAKDDLDDALIEAREDVAALHLLENLQILFDAEAKKMSDKWFAKYRNRIKKLPHDRQEAYRQIVALSTEPQDVKFGAARVALRADEGSRERWCGKGYSGLQAASAVRRKGLLSRRIGYLGEGGSVG